MIRWITSEWNLSPLLQDIGQKKTQLEDMVVGVSKEDMEWYMETADPL